MLTFYEHRQQKPCVFVDFCTHSCALYVRETCAYYTLTVSHVHAPDCHRQYLNCKHFNTSTVHYILNLEGPLQFCNVILSLYFFSYIADNTASPSLVKCQYLISGTVTELMDWRRKRLSGKRAPSTTYSFLKAMAHWIKMDGGINMTTLTSLPGGSCGPRGCTEKWEYTQPCLHS